MTSPLIAAAALAAIADDPTTRLADVRWYLDKPGRGHQAYHEGHLPGAVFVDLDRHLCAPEGPGRHPLPERSIFAATMGRLGFGDDHFIVVYDDTGGTIAARLWWMLRDVGHEAVRVLDGGIDAWSAAGHPLNTDAPDMTPRILTVRPGLTRQIDRETLAGRLGTIALLDARDPARYRGEVEPIDPVAGHIPTARSAPTAANLDAAGRLRTPDDLAEHFRALAPAGEVVVYCGSGVTACHDVLAMTVAGLPEPTLYPGSWSNWSSAGMPAATGDEPGEVTE